MTVRRSIPQPMRMGMRSSLLSGRTTRAVEWSTPSTTCLPRKAVTTRLRATYTGGDTGFSEDAIVASATQKTATATSSTRLDWAGSIATLKVAAAAATVPPVKLTVSGSGLFVDGNTGFVGPVTIGEQRATHTLSC